MRSHFIDGGIVHPIGWIGILGKNLHRDESHDRSLEDLKPLRSIKGDEELHLSLEYPTRPQVLQFSP